MSIGIIAACIPTLRPLYSYTRRKIKGEKVLDTNIRFPSSFKQSAWTETEDARGSGSDEKKGRYMEEGFAQEHSSKAQLGVQDILMSERNSRSADRRGKQGDTMRADLISQGIINPAAEHRSLSPPGTAVSRDSSHAHSPQEQLGIQDILMAERRSFSDEREAKRKDTMREELVGQGIIDPTADNKPVSTLMPSGSQRTERRSLPVRRRNESHDRGSNGSKRDAMRDELMHEGIVDPLAAQRSGNKVQLPVPADTLAPLDGDMHRYGIAK